MFAALLTETMDPFYEICSSFPTVIFTVLLAFCVFYWIFAVLGLVEIDALDFNFGVDDGGATDSVDNLNVMAGLLLKLGLNGVPFTIVLSLITLIGWLTCFTVVYFVFPWVPGALLEFIVGIPIFIGVLYMSAMVTAQIIRPLRPLFLEADQHVEKHIVGQVGIVRTGRVDKTFGEATVEDGGAGLIVKVRSYKDETFARGDRVILLEYDAVSNTYRVISEKDFLNN